jgi:mono/diheme cytochrome c family protein
MNDRRWAVIGRVLFVLLAAVVFGIAAALAIIIRHGVSARTEPTAIEVMLARSVWRMAIPAAARNMRNPLSQTPAVLAEGRDHFADHCAQCHANDGSGQTEMGQNLYPRVPDMRRDATQRLSDGQIFYIIKNGVRLTGMPAWGGEQEEQDNWKLVHFIRHLPKITPAEIEEMKKMNPTSPHERQEQKEEQEFLEGDHKHEAH